MASGTHVAYELYRMLAKQGFSALLAVGDTMREGLRKDGKFIHVTTPQGEKMMVSGEGGGQGPSVRVKNTVAKADSPVWKTFKPYKNNLKTNGLKGKEARYYEWDHLHNDIEVFNKGGNHLGSMDPATGKIYKLGVPGRSIKDKLR